MTEWVTAPLTDAEIAAARQAVLSSAARRIPAAAMASQARALGLWRPGGVRAAGEGQFPLVVDLAVFSPVGGHGRALDRELRARAGEEGTPEARVLAALAAARFTLFRLGAPLPGRGEVACEDLLTGEGFTLADARLSQPDMEGRGFAGRVMTLGGLRRTCGVCAPLTDAVIASLLGQPAPVAPMPEVLPPLAPLDEAARAALRARGLGGFPHARLRQRSRPQSHGPPARVAPVASPAGRASGRATNPGRASVRRRACRPPSARRWRRWARRRSASG